jgi:hypothetical protein
MEENLLNKNANVIGSIFYLKNNFGWVDKKEIVETKNKPDNIVLDL